MEQNSQITDEALAMECRHGTDSAFDKLVERYSGIVFGMAFKFLGDYHEAEDLAQTIFATVFESIDKFDPARSKFSTWLYGIASNNCLFHARTRRRMNSRIFAPGNAFLDSKSGNTVTPEKAAELSETRERLLKSMSHLEPEQRVILIARHFMEMEISDIAGAMNMTEGNVRVTLHRARSRLKAVFESGIS